LGGKIRQLCPEATCPRMIRQRNNAAERKNPVLALGPNTGKEAGLIGYHPAGKLLSDINR